MNDIKAKLKSVVLCNTLSANASNKGKNILCIYLYIKYIILGKNATLSTLKTLHSTLKMLQHHNLHLFQAYDEKLKLIRVSLFILSHCCIITFGDGLQSYIKTKLFCFIIL